MKYLHDPKESVGCSNKAAIRLQSAVSPDWNLTKKSFIKIEHCGNCKFVATCCNYHCNKMYGLKTQRSYCYNTLQWQLHRVLSHVTSSPWTMALSWHDGYMSKMSYKLSKLGQTDLVSGLWSEFIVRSVRAALQVSMCSGYDLCHHG